MILHIDMDAFFAAVEQLDHPGLTGKPVVVGGRSDRGVVMAASYEARRFGVHSAMPLFQARRKCPQAVFVPPRRQRYKRVSEQVMGLLRTFSPLVEQVSIDEAYMDAGGCRRLFGSPRELGMKIKNCIRKDIRLTCSIGIAPHRFLAKVASNMEKPDGLFIITAQEAPAFIDRLPVENVPGVGEKTLETLRGFGIQTLGQVRRYPEEMLCKRLGKFGARLTALAGGRDETPITPCRPHKSVSSEDTLARDTRDLGILKQHLRVQAESVGRELRRLNVRARTVTVKIKHSNFKVVTRSSTLSLPTQSSEMLYREAQQLLDAYALHPKIRLIGMGASGLVSAGVPVQEDLFHPRSSKWERVDAVLDDIRCKFGGGVVQKAAAKGPDPEQE